MFKRIKQIKSIIMSKVVYRIHASPFLGPFMVYQIYTNGPLEKKDFEGNFRLINKNLYNV